MPFIVAYMNCDVICVRMFVQMSIRFLLLRIFIKQRRVKKMSSNYDQMDSSLTVYRDVLQPIYPDIRWSRDKMGLLVDEVLYGFVRRSDGTLYVNHCAYGPLVINEDTLEVIKS